MNSSQSTPVNLASTQDEDTIDLLSILDVLLDARWLIIGVAGLVFILAAAYAVLSKPIYQADTLIQVEKNSNESGAALGEMSSLFNVDSTAAAEMEILRSRLILGQAVDQLQLNLMAEPNYWPIIGRWLSKRATELSDPGIFGFGNFVSGTESIKLQTFLMPESLAGQLLTLQVTDTGYTLRDPDDQILADGQIGKTVTFNYGDEIGVLYVTGLSGKPGACFNLKYTPRLQKIIELQNQLQISEKRKQSGIISGVLEGPDSKRIAQILNAIGSAYVEQNIARKAEEAEKSLTFLNEFLPQLQVQMNEAEQKYTRFRDQQGTFNLGAEGQLSLESSVKLQTKLLELQQKRRELLPKFQPNHPSIKTIDTQISAIKEELKNLEKSVKKLPDLEQQLLSLTRNVKVNSEMYVNLLNSAQQLRLVKEGKVGNVRIIDAAAVSDRPVKPRRLMILTLGAALGLIIGIAIALIRSWLRSGLQDAGEIEQALGLHVYATIPHSKVQPVLEGFVQAKQPGKHILADYSPEDPAIESLRSLRTALQFAMLKAPNNIVVFTGPTPAVGKSFTSTNFAAVVGKAGQRILLIDSDLRKGHIHQNFDLPRTEGLSELIIGNIERHQAIHKNVLNNVDFISTGVLPPNPAELLMSESFIEIIRDLANQYDLVLLDTAPVLAVSDTLALAPHAGTIFLVTRAGATTIGEIEESIKRLQRCGAEVSGVILNDLKARSHRYGTKYGHYSYTNYNYNTSES